MSLAVFLPADKRVKLSLIIFLFIIIIIFCVVAKVTVLVGITPVPYTMRRTATRWTRRTAFTRDLRVIYATSTAQIRVFATTVVVRASVLTVSTVSTVGRMTQHKCILRGIRQRVQTILMICKWMDYVASVWWRWFLLFVKTWWWVLFLLLYIIKNNDDWLKKRLPSNKQK